MTTTRSFGATMLRRIDTLAADIAAVDLKHVPGIGILIRGEPRGHTE